MQCPICPTLLLRLEVGPVELDECPRCLGMWFDRGELQELLGQALAATRQLPQRFLPPEGDAQLPGRVSCPRCVVGQLVPKEESGQKLAGCGRCWGLWVPGPLLAFILSSRPAEEQVAPPSPPAVPPPSPSPPLPAAAPPLGAAPAPMRVSRGCPGCGGELGLAAHQEQAFHRCRLCEGVFFPQGGLPFFLAHSPKSYRPPLSALAAEPSQPGECPGCGEELAPMSWQGQPARVWACQGCWSMFASALGMQKLVSPERFMEAPLGGPALALWRALDSFTGWLLKGTALLPSSGRRRRY